jgi:predicted CXXCH cytochrome family protein
MRFQQFASRLRTLFFATLKRAVVTVVIVLFLFLALVAGWFYRYITTGGLTARQSAPAFEIAIARRLINLSIPEQARSSKNPLSPGTLAVDLAIGRDLYQQNCQMCHGYDGHSTTATGGGLYPKPSNLHDASVTRQPDGAIFYIIRNGIRNTGMPAFSLTDQQTWQIIACVRNLPITAHMASAESTPILLASAHYVGSASCAACHKDIYQRWKTTLMANVVRDPREHPDAIIPDLSQSNPLVKFSVADISFVYGQRWKQRYFKKIGDDYYPLPAQWDVTHKQWKPYFVKDDWWAPLYPPNNFQRPTSSTCDGCHSVNYNIDNHTVTEWNVGCEKCHGPGSIHVANPLATNIVNPARLNYVQANDTCIQCHSQGRPLTNPVNGRYYDWPVGFNMGAALSSYWKLEPHELGQTTFTHFPDGTAHKNRMQGNDYVTAEMYTHGVTCFTCHDSHGTSNIGLLRKPAATLCLDCHGPTSPNGPHAATIEAHTRHKPNSTGSQCIACHMPQIAQTLGDVNVSSHTFRFIPPSETESLKIPNACNVCHADKSTQWATDALSQWIDRSTWRMNTR